MASQLDVIVIGGGPGGSVCAAKLAEQGHRVLVLEREKFPRFHLGESLLPQSMPLLEGLGVMPTLREKFIPKYGAHFHFDEMERNKKERYVFANAFDKRFDHAFQVPRDEFDQVLLHNAERKGAEVRHGWTVKRIRFTQTEEGDRATGVDVVDPKGTGHVIGARMIVDATGRDALHAGDRRNKSRIDRLDKSAFYTHYRGTKRHPGIEEGDIDIVLFGGGWFWFIPFKDGRTSVGAVVSSAWVQEHHERAPDAAALLACAIEESPSATSLVEGAEALWPARAAADYSYRVKETHGNSWIMVGDSGGFVDPLFSSGVHIAISAAVRGAERISEGLEENDLRAERFRDWAAEVKLGTDTFVNAVQAFYAGGLVRYLFAEKKHTFLRNSITSLLAGDVYSPDARWIKDVRVRLAEMASPDWTPAPIIGL